MKQRFYRFFLFLRFYIHTQYILNACISGWLVNQSHPKRHQKLTRNKIKCVYTHTYSIAEGAGNRQCNSLNFCAFLNQGEFLSTSGRYPNIIQMLLLFFPRFLSNLKYFHRDSLKHDLRFNQPKRPKYSRLNSHLTQNTQNIQNIQEKLRDVCPLFVHHFGS